MIREKPSPAVTLEVPGIVQGATAFSASTYPRLMLTIESGIAAVEAENTRHLVDRSTCIVIPAGQSFTISPSSALVSVAMLSFHELVMQRTVATHSKLGANRARLERWLTRVQLWPRTVWMHEIVHRYIFERVVLNEQNNPTCQFLEIEIVKELYFLFRDREDGADRASLERQHGPLVASALSFIESELFSRCDVKGLARRVGSSESSLLRAFRREVGQTPAAYWRRRKMDAALSLLRSGTHTIAHIAEMLGYEDPAAFGDAFRRHLGQPPSAFKPRGLMRRAP